MLTIEELIFVEEYMVDLDDKKAQKRANISPYNPHLLEKPEVRREIERRTEEKIASLSITSDYILSRIKDVVEETSRPIPKTQINKDGEQIFFTDPEGNMIFERNYTAELKALELLGKYKSLFTDKSESTINVNSIDHYLSQVEDKEEW